MNNQRLAYDLFSIGFENDQAIKATIKYRSEVQKLTRKLNRLARKLEPGLREELETYVMALRMCTRGDCEIGQMHRVNVRERLAALEEAANIAAKDEAFIAMKQAEFQARDQRNREAAIARGEVVQLRGARA